MDTRSITYLVGRLVGDSSHQVFPATVTAVDEAAGVCTVEDERGLPIEDVALTATPYNTADLLVIPATGSQVLVGMIANEPSSLYVAMFSEVARVIYHGGEWGGLVKAPELQAQAEKVSAFMQSLLAVVNGAPIPEPGAGAPSAFQTALKAALAAAQVPTWADLENPKVQH